MGLSDCIDCWDTPCTCTDKADSPIFWSSKVFRIKEILRDGALTDEEMLDRIEAVANEKPAPQCKQCSSTQRPISADDMMCDPCRQRKQETAERLGLPWPVDAG